MNGRIAVAPADLSVVTAMWVLLSGVMDDPAKPDPVALESRARRDPGFPPWVCSPGLSILSFTRRARALRVGRGDSRRSLAAASLRRRVSERAAATDRSLAGVDGIREDREHPCLARCRTTAPFGAALAGHSTLSKCDDSSQGPDPGSTRARNRAKRATVTHTQQINRGERREEITTRLPGRTLED